MKKLFVILSLVLMSGGAFGACLVKNSVGGAARPWRDPLMTLLLGAEACPRNVVEFKGLLSARGFTSAPSMVANRGFHNPALGSFSFFEVVTGNGIGDGEFYFGHFVGAEGGMLSLEQTPSAGALMIELIVWDGGSRMFRFYEMIGDGHAGQWFYRGDTEDILRDNRWVHLDQPAGQPKFGNRLRCAGCHSSGGPIMKELAFPHNDWWTSLRPLPLAMNKPDAAVGGIMAQLRDASLFAKSVATGMQKLENSIVYRNLKSSRTLPEELRPLFCENEINLASDSAPFDQTAAVQIPSAFLVNPRLAVGSFAMPKGTYAGLLAKYGLKFPETNRKDGDHAFLAPVRSMADELAVNTLVQRRLIDDEFVADVLAIDMMTPLFSKDRCSLLKAVPLFANGAWRSEFEKNLEALKTPAALELLENLRSPARNAVFHRQQAFASMRASAMNVEGLFRKLLTVRAAAAASEISQNPRGRILEPGFRVIFPVPAR